MVWAPPRIEQTIACSVCTRENRFEFVFRLWKLFGRGEVFRQGSLKLLSFPYEIVNRGCPLLDVVPRRFLLGIELAVRASTGDHHLEVRPSRFEGKPVVMSHGSSILSGSCVFFPIA